MALKQRLEPQLLGGKPLLQFKQPEGDRFSHFREGLQLISQPLGAVCNL